jgi:hypothetical protein
VAKVEYARGKTGRTRPSKKKAAEAAQAAQAKAEAVTEETEAAPEGNHPLPINVPKEEQMQELLRNPDMMKNALEMAKHMTPEQIVSISKLQGKDISLEQAQQVVDALKSGNPKMQSAALGMVKAGSMMMDAKDKLKNAKDKVANFFTGN